MSVSTCQLCLRHIAHCSQWQILWLLQHCAVHVVMACQTALTLAIYVTSYQMYLGHQSSTTGQQRSTISPLRLIGHQRSLPGHQRSAVGHQWLVGHQRSPVGRRRSQVGHQWLVGHQRSPVGQWQWMAMQWSVADCSHQLDNQRQRSWSLNDWGTPRHHARNHLKVLSAKHLHTRNRSASLLSTLSVCLSVSKTSNNELVEQDVTSNGCLGSLVGGPAIAAFLRVISCLFCGTVSLTFIINESIIGQWTFMHLQSIGGQLVRITLDKIWEGYSRLVCMYNVMHCVVVFMLWWHCYCHYATVCLLLSKSCVFVCNVLCVLTQGWLGWHFVETFTWLTHANNSCTCVLVVHAPCCDYSMYVNV